MWNHLDPLNDTHETIGQCDQCGTGLRADYDYIEDGQYHKFCDEDCAKEYYGIRTVYAI